MDDHKLVRHLCVRALTLLKAGGQQWPCGEEVNILDFQSSIRAVRVRPGSPYADLAQLAGQLSCKQ